MDDRGIEFPTTESGRRSTTAFVRAVFDHALGDDLPTIRGGVSDDKWRTRYPADLVAISDAEIVSSSVPLEVARRGLTAVHDGLRFRSAAGERSLSDAMGSDADGAPFETGTVPATAGDRPEFQVPYRGELLGSSRLRAQVERWVGAGVMEPSAATALEEVLDNEDWLDLRDHTVVVLGAGAELGPYPALMGMGATVAAVDLPHAAVWDRLLARAGHRSTVIYPQRDGRPGADLAGDLLELRDWLARIVGPVVIGGYAYADGADHVRVSAAQDALIAHASDVRSAGEVTVAHLLTPTDAYAIPEAAAEASRRAWDGRPAAIAAAQAALRTVSGGRLFVRAIDELRTGSDGFRSAVFDTLVVQQGFNYALAKRIQRWRGLTARAAGSRTSINISPSSNTRSVTKNRALAAAYDGADLFGIEVFEPDTTNALMALLLVRDLRTSNGPADPSIPLANPVELFTDAAVHGGLWRSPYVTRSALPLAAIKGFAPF